jgi:hypothetical protein
MARRKRASMREGPLADLFRSTEVPEDPPEAPAPPPRRDEPSRDDETRVLPSAPEPEASEPEPPARDPEPAPPSRSPIFDVEEDDPVAEVSTAPGAKERLSRIFAEDSETSGAMYGRDEPDY